MSFTIDHGFPGIGLVILALVGAGAAAILLRFLLSVVLSARTDVIEAEEDEERAGH